MKRFLTQPFHNGTSFTLLKQSPCMNCNNLSHNGQSFANGAIPMATRGFATKKLTVNVEEHGAAEKAKFSRSRYRETSSGQIGVKATQPGAMFTGNFMSDQGSSKSNSFNSGSQPSDKHVGVYDRNNTVSLSSVVQGNVPSPFQIKGNLASAHVNMTGGQWIQDDKYLAGDQHEVHNAKTKKRVFKNGSKNGLGTEELIASNNLCCIKKVHCCSFASFLPSSLINLPHRNQAALLVSRFALTNSTREASSSSSSSSSMNQRQRLKAAVRDYGSTVIVFHISIALVSLGICCLLVSSGIDMDRIVDHLGVDLSTLGDKIDTLKESLPLTKDSDDEAPSADNSENDAGNVDLPVTRNRVSVVASNVGTFVVAYAVHKVTAPLRIGITLTATPFIVRHLRKIGFLKTPKRT